MLTQRVILSVVFILEGLTVWPSLSKPLPPIKNTIYHPQIKSGVAGDGSEKAS